MSRQNRISYGYAPPNCAEKGYSPKKILDRNKLASAENPLAYQNLIQVTVPSNIFGKGLSNYFEVQKNRTASVNNGDSMNLRLFQLAVRVAFESKELYDRGLSKQDKTEPKIVGYRGQLAEKNFFVNENSSLLTTLNAMLPAQVEAWAAAQNYQIIDEAAYVAAWEQFAAQPEGDGGVYVFLETIPKSYDDEELKHAAAYRLWILLEKGCSININDQFQSVITPSEDRKKKVPIAHHDQYRRITNNGKFCQHVSNLMYRDEFAMRVAPEIKLTNENGNPICPTNVFDPKVYFDHVTHHKVDNNTRQNVIPLLFPGNEPDTEGFRFENYVVAGDFVVHEKIRPFMIEMTTEDLTTETFMKKYKPDVWLFYILTKQVHSILNDYCNSSNRQSIRNNDYLVDSTSQMLEQFKISTNNRDYALNGHALPTVWADSKGNNDDRDGKCWEEGVHDVMRLRTETYHQEVPKYNDEMSSATTSEERHKIFFNFFKKSATAFGRVMVPEAVVDPATHALINYPHVLKNEHNYSTKIEPAWTFEANTMGFFDVFLQKLSAGLEFFRFVSTHHFTIILLTLTSGCSRSLIQEKTHSVIQGPGCAGKSNALNNCANLKCPGTVQNLTQQSTLAGTDIDCFNTIVQEHEQDADAAGHNSKHMDNKQMKATDMRKNETHGKA